MYVVTFYSFKGGVGRSMALVNVGVELARRGRRVLLVDLDLEAPGLTTFNLARPQQPGPGVVHFIADYLDSGQVPDVNRYVYESSDPQYGAGKLWVMPAGGSESDYLDRYSRIDWESLYRDNDGFLLFEDLREQWRQQLAPDYVLIDSRTGFSDIAGVCTRQLPDAVCVLFFPNDQNLRGLIPVVDLVRTAPASVGGRRPVLHFVVSNIPDLDDENEILAERLDKFSDKLGYEEAEFIHHYHSLSLLNQAVFTLERPKTRLAQEYQALTNRIVSGNVEDVEAMLAYLQEVFQDDSRAVYDRLSDVEEHLIRILEAHPNNGEIHFWAARVKRRANFLLDALALVEAAIAKGYVDTQAYTDRLFYLYLLNRRDVAREQATELLTGSNRQYSRRDVAQVLWVAMQLGGFSATTLADSAPVRALGSEDRVSTATVMDDSALALETAGSMAAAVLKQPNVPRKLELEAREIVAQSYLARGELKPALDVLLVDRARDLGFHAAYLIGFASYWAKALDPAPYMRQFVNTPQAATVRSDPYYLQCLAFAHWALGDLALALKCLHQAREHATNLHYRCASTWRFMRVTSEQFAEDCDEMLALFNGEMREPVLMRQGET